MLTLIISLQSVRHMRFANKTRSALIKEALTNGTDIRQAHHITYLMDRYIAIHDEKKLCVRSIFSSCAKIVQMLADDAELKSVKAITLLKKVGYQVYFPMAIDYLDASLENFYDYVFVLNLMIIDGSYFAYDQKILAAKVMRIPKKLFHEHSYDMGIIELAEPIFDIPLVDVSIMDKNQVTIYLGEGSFGSVYKQKYKGYRVAVKYIKGNVNKDMLREVSAMARLDNHPNVIKLVGVVYDNNRMVIVTELLDRTLFQYMNSYKLTTSVKKCLAIHLLRGLVYVHNNGIIHRDLSINNVMMSEDGVLKIIDFGSSCLLNNSGPITYKDLCAPYFRSIEMHMGLNSYDQKSDVWSAACIIGYIFQGTSLFSHKGTILEGIYHYLGTPDIDSVVRQYKGFVNEEYKPFKGFKQLEQNHPDVVDILYKMLEYDPNERLSSSEALELFEKLIKNDC